MIGPIEIEGYWKIGERRTGYHTIYVVQPLDFKDELTSLYEIKVYLIEPCNGSKPRSWHDCQRMEVETIDTSREHDTQEQ
jgi:hypothetical protein